MPSPDEAASDGYFNDLTQQVPDQPNQSQQPKSKRVACVLCRKRKLRCDGAKPSCATCTRLSHNCAYDEVRKKSGPKRGYVKELEARLAQVETLLNTHAAVEMPLNAIDQPVTNGEDLPDFGGIDPEQTRLMQEMHVGHSPPTSSNAMPSTRLPSMSDGYDAELPQFWKGDIDPQIPTWAPNLSLLSTGMEEPLPPPEVCADLTSIFFERCHPSAPLLHRPRFLMAMQNTSPALRPRLSLQYAVWTLAASAHPKYEDMVDTLYRRARHYLERDEMFGVGERMINLATVQAWQCISAYEFKMMYFPRAWLSTGRTSRLALMMGLHRVDGPNIDVKQCLPPPKDWIEKEERRRLFWLTFAADRYASIGTGWPMTIDESDIYTDLPSSEEAFEYGNPEPSMSLQEALTPGGADTLSSCGSVGVISALFGRNLLHLHRQTPDQNDGDVNGVFWKRHRQMDGTILTLLLGLPESLRLPLAASDPKVVFMNMCVHTSVICLHQAAIFKVEKHSLPAKLAAESKMRCLTAAAEISSLMKMTSHLDMAQANPFMAFSLYVAARVFVQYLKSRPRDDTARGSLHFLLSALQAMKKTNPLAESFIAQLDVDLEVAGLEELRSLRVRAARKAQAQANANMSCPYAESNIKNGGRPTFGDDGLAKHTDPRGSGNHPSGGNFPPEIAEMMQQHSGNFKGIFPVRMNISSDSSTAHTSPQTLGSSDGDVMELCNTGVSPSDSSSSSQPANHSAVVFRQSSNNWQPFGQSQQQSPELLYATQPPQQSPQFNQQTQSSQQQQPTLFGSIQDTPMSTLLPPQLSEFGNTEFLNFSKTASATVLELGAVDEGQLFQLSDAEWGQVMGEFGDDLGGGGSMGELQWESGVRGAFGS
ncbi:hypothetical protein E4T43_00057 [Aureobasidium subglaciale]|nr:hypothetical protein E4T43_00057 [Aureobasidium subglaciale]